MILYRGIRLHSLLDFDQNRVGVCWTPDLIKARYYATDPSFSREGSRHFLLEADVPEHFIDAPSTGWLYSTINREIRLKTESNISFNVYEVFGKRLTDIRLIYSNMEGITNQISDKYLNDFKQEHSGVCEQICLNLKEHYLYPNNK